MVLHKLLTDETALKTLETACGMIYNGKLDSMIKLSEYIIIFLF